MAWLLSPKENGMENHGNLHNLDYLPYILESRFEDSLYLNYYRNRIHQVIDPRLLIHPFRGLQD